MRNGTKTQGKLTAADIEILGHITYFRFHALRHFGASVLDRANISLGSIQRILGNENRTTTEIYLHSIDEIDRAAMEYLGALIEKKSHTDSHTEKNKGLR